MPGSNVPRLLDPQSREALAERLRFYRDLGVTDFYRRPVEETFEVMSAPEVVGAPIPLLTPGKGTRVPKNILCPIHSARRASVCGMGGKPQILVAPN